MRFRLVFALAILGLLGLGGAYAKSQADDLRDRLRAGLAPYLAAVPGEGRFDYAEPLRVTGPDKDGAYTLTIDELAYRAPLEGGEMATLDLGSLPVRLLPGKDTQAVSGRLAGPIRFIADGQVRATLEAKALTFQGAWSIPRQAFTRLEVSAQDVDLALANGDRIAIGQARGFFTLRGDEGPVAGTIELVDYKGRKAADQSVLILSNVRLELSLAERRTKPRLDVDLRYQAPLPADAGPAGELTPLSLRLKAQATPFPWQAALRDLPSLFADARPNPFGPAWERLKGRLHDSRTHLTLVESDARSVGLQSSGAGEARFAPTTATQGRFLFEVQGLNERIAGLSRSGQPRKQAMQTFGLLALVSALGEGVQVGGERRHRYRIDLTPEGGFAVNGRDLSVILTMADKAAKAP
ncbi:MAG: hypothetical protein HZC25_00890 [Rhodospirillales bacterium]|nr:hypothetical protein [Rhodospirillales bacterium]